MLTIAAWLFGVDGGVLVGIGVYFLLFRPSLLPEDLRFLGLSLPEVDDVAPRLRIWLRRVFLVLGGHALAAGALTIFIAATAIRDRQVGAVVVLALSGAASIGLMAAVNVAIRSDFRWALLAATVPLVAATGFAVWS